MHMFIRAEIDGNLVMRSYIPIVDDETTGHVDLLVNVYGRGVHPSFPDGGKMSQHLDSLSDGDSIEVRGPVRELVYKGHVLTITKVWAATAFTFLASQVGLV